METDFPAEDIQVETDPNGLKVVVNNLLGNAIKYSPEMSLVTVGYGWSADHKELVITVKTMARVFRVGG